MEPTQQLDRTFVNLTDDPAQGRGARRTYIRRAVMKNYHKRRSQKKKKTSGHEAEIAAGTQNVVNSRLSPQMSALIPRFSLFEPRKFSEPPMMQMSNSVLRYLCGQASKVAHDLSLVAFLHPSSEQELDSGFASPNPKRSPLKTCQNLLRAYGSCKSETLGVGVDKEPLWEMIHQHQEWIYAHVGTLSNWELLSAAQAVAVYVLLRVKLGRNNPAFPNGDIALLYTLGAIFRRLQVEGTLDASQHPRDDWKQWIFYESFVRVATIYFTLNVVISMEIGLPCNSPLDWNTEGMLLPASKASWSAHNIDDWKKRRTALSSCEQLKWKDLLDTTPSGDCPVEEWRESSDELGLLVTMTMTLRAQLLREATRTGSSPYRESSASCLE